VIITGRHSLVRSGLIFLVVLLTSCIIRHAPDSRRDYSRLVELIKTDDLSTPLYVFNDFEEDFDEDAHRASIGFLNGHTALIKKIQKDLESKCLKWRLDKLVYRMVFVPEKRKEYATLFETYCSDVIEYTLAETRLSNPYQTLQTLVEGRPKVADEGVTAFLVHNLAKEYVARYAFINRERKKVVIELRGTVFSGKVGSYTTNIFMEESGEFRFIRDDYTIWQNSAKNPYTVLMVPVEETLHIALREHTERAIKAQLELKSVQGLGDVKRIADDWMAVEEAIVGGLVHAMLPQFLEEHIHNLPNSLVEEDIESKMEFKQYRYLRKAIEVVGSMGCKKAVKIYKKDPMEFKNLLI
jgi:hypothetical protein